MFDKDKKRAIITAVVVAFVSFVVIFLSIKSCNDPH